MTEEKLDSSLMLKIVSLCKRRGFIFQSAEIYGGLNGCWDYGPLGVEIKNNVKKYWWLKNVQLRDDVVGLDGSILTHQNILKASGHVGGFSDPMSDCLLTKARFRSDQVPLQSGTVYSFEGARHPETNWSIQREYAVLVKDNESHSKAIKMARRFFYQFLNDKQISPKSLELIEGDTKEVVDSTNYNPENGSLLTAPKSFDLMFKTHVGASADSNDEKSIAYLRPETAQSIFSQFKNVFETNRLKLPFGIAQIGKSFRNEINPRNYTFRSREFEQMEIEFFCAEEDGLRLTEEWLEKRLCFYEEIGIPRNKLNVYDVPDDDRAHYSQKTYDIEYKFPFGVQELEGIAYRGNYDLINHQDSSGKSLEFFDDVSKKKFIPHVVEPSAGCDRTILALICEAYKEETITNDKGKEEIRILMRFSPKVAPVKVAILPLLKNNENLVAKAKEIHKKLQFHMNSFYDETGAIGRRYRRQDEIGTPFCVTIDFETLGDNDASLKDTVTLRHRDTMQQERIKISDLLPFIIGKIS